MWDQAELTKLYRCHGPAVFRRARRLLGSEAEAHEVVQDVFLSLFERPEQYRGKSNLTTFLYSATTHACLNRLRNQRTRRRLTEQHGAELVPSEAPSAAPDDLLQLQRALCNMPEELAQVAVYHYADGLTQDEIAQLMGCSRRHIGNQLGRVQRWASEQERA
jgi:RNA polymerase sigma-70 factor (ECF subfamily)